MKSCQGAALVQAANNQFGPDTFHTFVVKNIDL